MFSSDDHDGKWTWLICVGWATAVQVLLIILCFIVRNVQSMAVFLVLLYLPGAIVAADHLPMSASAARILFFLSVAFYSVLFGSLVYFGHRYIRFLRSNGEDRPQKPVSESEPETREGQGETSSNCESDGGAKWGCCVSVLVVLQPLLHLFGLLHLANGDVLGSLYEQYVCKPAEWLLPVSPQHYTGTKLLPVELFLLLVVGTFYSVLFGTLFYWLCRGSSCLFKLVLRKAGKK